MREYGAGEDTWAYQQASGRITTPFRPRGPWDRQRKSITDLNRRKEWAMLVVHPVLTIVAETRCSWILKLQVENVMVYYHAQFVNDV
jgi:hypothetical protein